MNVKSTLTLGMAALATASFASAQDIPGATVINITGATAFRSASHTSLVALLGGNGVTQYAYTGNSGLSGANRSIFSGTIGGQPYIVRCSWSGSTEGIKAVADATGVELLTTANTRTTGGMNLGQGANPAPAYENGIPRFSFSDVDKALSERPNAPLSGGPVGVVPFMFVAGFSAPAGMTNMTDQVHEALWSVGQGPLSLFTGNPNDTTIVLPTGRNNGSGTRATILAETGYGPFRSIAQWNSTFTGNRGSGSLAALSEFGNNGHTSNSGVRDLLTRDSSNVTLNGDAFSVIFVSYLTISDAVAATGYNQLTGTISGGEGAKPMTYNGVRFSEENVKNGSYTLWGYQQLYRVASATAAELTFDTALRNTIPNNMGSAGIPLPQMHVSRAGGDGGLVQPLGE